MNNKIILAKVLKKLAKIDQNKINDFVSTLTPVINDPKKVILTVQKFQDDEKMSQKEKLQLLNEIKKRDLIKLEVPNMERAWRLIIKNWKIPNYRLWS